MNSSCPHQMPKSKDVFYCSGGKHDGKTVSAGVCRFCLKSPELPPLQTQAVNAAKAVGRVASALATGQPVLVSEEVRESRLAICHDCDQWIEKRKRCAKCGCFTDKKIRLATESCPLGKWTVE